jgi:aspartate kinase
MAEKVRVQVLSSFTDEPGTLVVDEDEIVEQQVVSGITYSRDEARLTVVGVREPAGRGGRRLRALAAANINVDMIVQSVSRDGVYANMTFTVARNDLGRAQAVLAGEQGRSSSRRSSRTRTWPRSR